MCVFLCVSYECIVECMPLQSIAAIRRDRAFEEASYWGEEFIQEGGREERTEQKITEYTVDRK